MEEFSEQELKDLIDQALATKNSDKSVSPKIYLGLGETDLLESIHQRLSKRVIESDLNTIFRDLRSDILSRKISTSRKDLHTVTLNCKKCEIDSSAELPKWNVDNPDVVVVIDSPSLPADAINLMVNTFKKIGFSSDQLCLTYVNRCPVKRKYESSEVINCSHYLHLELQILNPKLIFCLGATPLSVLFGTDIKIKDVRGKLLWLGYWPIIGTYSPMYTLKSELSDVFESDVIQAYNFVINNDKEKNNVF